MSKNIAIILSGGTGTRIGGNVPKQYLEVNGKAIIMYCVETIARMPEIDELVICLADEWESFVKGELEKAGVTKKVIFSQPGEIRQLTIYNALKVLHEQGLADDAVVVIHDAARPLVSEALLRRCIEGCKEADGVLPVLPVKDTLYMSKDGNSISSLLKRSEIVAGQAPEAFRFGKYIAVHDQMSYEDILKISGSTEIAYKAGLNIKLVPGEELNFKITTTEDLDNLKHVLER